MHKQKWIFSLCFILIFTSNLAAQKYKSGSTDIDKVRNEVTTQKTTKANRGDFKEEGYELSALDNNVLVVEILEAALISAPTGKKVELK